MLLLVWVSWLHCNGTVCSVGVAKGSELVVENVGSLLGCPLTLIELSTIPFEGMVKGESAFIAVDGECSGGEE